MKERIEKKELSEQDVRVIKIMEEISKQYEMYLKLSALKELSQEESFEEIPCHDWSTPLNLVIHKENKNAFME